MDSKAISRRSFLVSSTTAILAGCASGPPKETAPAIVSTTSANEKLNIAAIGAGGKGGSDIRSVARENIVALCDVDWARAAGSFNAFPNIPKYKDFRIMLEKEKSIDAVTISTPDHTHAAAAMAAMELGKGVYVQKPLTHTIYEARTLRETARRTGVATQMGNQGHSGEGVRRVCEWVWDGGIGDVHEVHIWTNRPVWPQGIDRPTDTPPVPETLDWDLWVGPSPMRPYHPAYVPFSWRGWWYFGCGALGDMACHIMDPANWALKLGEAEGIIGVQAESSPVNNETAPEWSIITFEIPARAGMPPVKLVWYDGGKQPPRPEGIGDEGLGDGENGSLFIGDKGMITCGEYGGSPRLVPRAAMKAYDRPPRSIPKSIGHYREWIAACKGGEPAGSNFEYAAPFTELVLLGNLALRSGGKKLEYDREKMAVVNEPDANQFIQMDYRQGWSL